MDVLDALNALQVGGTSFAGVTQAAKAATGTQSIGFDSLLEAAAQDEEGRGSASAVQDALTGQISERIDGAPNYLYAIHPSVYQKMADDPDFLQTMVDTVDSWTSSQMFLEAKSSSDIFSSLLTGEDGSFAMASTRVGDLAGTNSILDLAVSDSSLLSQSGMASFLAQFDGLPEELVDTLISNFTSVEGSGAAGDDNAYYQAMAAAAEVQKRMLLD